MHKFPKSGHGFTLIELLIVVAIIAILAAIAVPNFLEAQTRSKVSRAKSDLRTIQTGLEAYRVDNNGYPYSESIGPAVWLLPGGNPRMGAERVGGLTTPISYLTSLPHDAFDHIFTDAYGNQKVERGPYYFERAGFGYVNGVRVNQVVRVPTESVGTSSLVGIGADTIVQEAGDTPRLIHLTDLSNGSILTRSRYNLNNRYDPTNGTISGGNILRYPGGESFP
jgi:type II secretion system protein G